MTSADIVALRLASQRITGPGEPGVAAAVAALGALQSQDYTNALWSLGLRTIGATEPAVEQAIARREVVRTWPMRGTLHFVAAADARWMLALLTPRVLAGTAKRCAELELDEKVFARCRKAVTKILQGNRQLTRDSFLEHLEKTGISTADGRSYHIPFRLAQEGLICFGPREGKQLTYVLLEEWLTPAPMLEGEAALAELARRYFTSHGPATLRDFIWWSGLKAADARAALDLVSRDFTSETLDGATYWLHPSAAPHLPEPAHFLPAFDEYLLGYTGRSAVLDAKHAQRVIPGGNGVFLPIFLVNGRVAGTWKRTVKKRHVAIIASPFRALKRAEKSALHEAAATYAAFLDLEPELSFQ